MINSQFPQTIWVTTTIQFRDIQLGQHHAILHTSIYHESMTEDNILPPSLDVIQRPIHDTWKWVQIALLREIRYSSNDDAFDGEKLIIKSALQRNGFAAIIFHDSCDTFLTKFSINMMYPPSNRCGYQTLRENVFHCDNSFTSITKTITIKTSKITASVASFIYVSLGYCCNSRFSTRIK